MVSSNGKLDAERKGQVEEYLSILAYTSNGTPKLCEGVTTICPYSWVVRFSWKNSAFNHQWKWLMMMASTQEITDILLSPARIDAPHTISGRSLPSLFLHAATNRDSVSPLSECLAVFHRPLSDV